MDDLILNHTMFPQYARFMPADKREVALAELKRYCDPHKVFTILPRNDRELWLKYCPLCVAEDRKKYGETYWHRVHQVRNMLICTIHKCKLKNSNIDARSEKVFAFNPAELSVKNTEPTFAFEYNHKLTNYSQYIAEIFTSELEKDSSMPISVIIYDAMKKSKYMKGQHRNMELFMADFQGFFTEMGLNSIISIHQIRRVMLKNGTEFSAICQIAYFLDIYASDLLHPTLKTSKIQEENDSHYIRNRPAVDWQKFDKEKAPLLKAHCNAIYIGSASVRPERVSEKEVCRFLKVTLDGFKNLSECQKVWRQYEETYDESNARKIVWAFNKLRSDSLDKKLYFLDLRRLTGVKKQRFPPFDLVEKHSNTAIATEIFALL